MKILGMLLVTTILLFGCDDSDTESEPCEQKCGHDGHIYCKGIGEIDVRCDPPWFMCLPESVTCEPWLVDSGVDNDEN